MSLLLLTEEDNDALSVDILAQVQQISDSLVLSSWTKTDELLHKGRDCVLLGIDHQAHRAVHANSNKLVDGICHGS